MDGIIRNVKIGSSIDCSGHALVEITILRNIGQVKSKVKTLDFRTENIQFRELEDGTPWQSAFRDKGAEQSWKHFKDIFLHKSSRFPHVRNQERKAGHQNG